MNALALEQRRSALANANAVRAHRSELKQDLASGRTTIAEVLRSDDPLLHTMRLRDLLLATPTLGGSKVRRVLDGNQISWSTQLQNFPAQRREQLLCWIAARHSSVPLSSPTREMGCC